LHPVDPVTPFALPQALLLPPCMSLHFKTPAARFG
jgi:hypothetical protein